MSALTAPSLPASLAAIGAGAALGAWMRWGLGLLLNRVLPTLPPGTLAANLIGGFVIGVALAWWTEHPGAAPWWRLFLVTGLLGGLTTFSTFSAEVVDNLLHGRGAWAVATVVVHVAGSLLATLAGVAAWRALA